MTAELPCKVQGLTALFSPFHPALKAASSRRTPKYKQCRRYGYSALEEIEEEAVARNED
jgi:hypothetical protein